MLFIIFNREILALETEIARRCGILESLHAAGSHTGDEARHARVELDCLLLGLRDAQRERDKLLIECGFPAALGWASRQFDCDLLRPLYTRTAQPPPRTTLDVMEHHGSSI